MLSARESHELALIAVHLQQSDRILARRLARHRMGREGLGVRHPWLPTALLTAGVVATACVGLGLLTAAIAAGWGPVCLAAGIVLLVAVPFSPVLVGCARRRRPGGRSAAAPRPGPAP